MGPGRKSPLHSGLRGFEHNKSPPATQVLTEGRRQSSAGSGRRSDMLAPPLKCIPHTVRQPWRETKRHQSQRNKRTRVSLPPDSRAVTVCHPEVPLQLHRLPIVSSLQCGIKVANVFTYLNLKTEGAPTFL